MIIHEAGVQDSEGLHQVHAREGRYGDITRRIISGKKKRGWFFLEVKVMLGSKKWFLDTQSVGFTYKVHS